MSQSSIPAIIAARRSGGEGLAPWSSPLAPLPADIEDILKCAAGDSAALAEASAAADTRPQVAESACRWFIRDVLFRPGANHYWNLGVERDASMDSIRAHYRHLISIFHPDRLQQSDEREWYESFAKRVNEAYNTLKNPEMRLRYDRLLGGGHSDVASASATAQPTTGQQPTPKRRAPLWTRASWRNAPTRGSVSDWADQRRPATLKVLSVGAVVLLAVGGALLYRAQTSGRAEIALPTDVPVPLSGERDVRFADLVPQPAPSVVPPMAGPATKPAIQALAVTAVDNSVPVPPRAAVAIVQPPVAAPAPATPAAMVVAPVLEREPLRTAASTRPEPVVPAPAIISPAATAAVAPAPTDVIAVVAATPAEQVVRPSDADIDLVVARFARAYDAGDFPALMSLIDPEAARGDGMAFTLANFNRLFRDSASRHIELREVQRVHDNDRTRVQLKTRTMVIGKTSGQRTDVGQMMFTVRKRGDGVVIAELAYREGNDG